MRGIPDTSRHIGQEVNFGRWYAAGCSVCIAPFLSRWLRSSRFSGNGEKKAWAAGVFTAEEYQRQLAKLKHVDSTAGTSKEESSQGDIAHWSEPMAVTRLPLRRGGV